jgi:TolB-like protein
MASLIPGFEYDIFISYRQKDNKYDGWVTEFVDHLKRELEATFKDDISVYFDINPHDGLLETHDVDASLKEKLKCLIFIPIISRTYCDPKSFAWEHEFKAFVEQASQDQFALKVKLPNGNIANRVLPVQIHELNLEDRKLIEDELRGYLRGIEFIYKEPGVNRPLMANEDHPDNNLDKVFYRNQINKVANAINEIIDGLRISDRSDKGISEKIDEEKPLAHKNLKPKIIIVAVTALLLIFLGYFFIPKYFKSSKLAEKSVAVLPFLNYSTEPDQEAMSEGLTDEIINHLFQIKSFDKVVSLHNVLTYKGTHKNISQIASELQVNYILEGTYKKIGDQVKIRSTLIEPKNDKPLWQNEYERPYKELIAIQADIALQIANNLEAFLTNSELQNIQKIPTNNQEAYELIQKVLYLLRKEGDQQLFQTYDLVLKAIKLDPDYVDANALAGIEALYTGGFAGPKGMPTAILDALPFFEKALELDQS